MESIVAVRQLLMRLAVNDAVRSGVEKLCERALRTRSACGPHALLYSRAHSAPCNAHAAPASCCLQRHVRFPIASHLALSDCKMQ